MQRNHEEKIALPAEWEPQSATLLVWPHIDTDWQDILNEIEPSYLELSKAISRYQKLLIVCRDTAHQENISHQLAKNGIPESSCHIISCDYNDTWCRDYGPIFIRNDYNFIIKNFTFNGWSNKYPSEQDNQLTEYLYKQNTFKPNELCNHDFILEGGSIDSDGQGTILTSSSCILKRHPDKDKPTLEKLLHEYLGVNKIHWLDYGKLIGDDTDGHIDTLARFVNTETIVYSACQNRSNPNYLSLKKMENELYSLKQHNGEAYQLIPIGLPNPIEHKGQILPANYINFVIINQAVLVPNYNDPQDKVAMDIFKQCFPGREIIGIDSNTLITQYGSLHCATLNIPAGVLNLETPVDR